jgi:hypothetical protein
VAAADPFPSPTRRRIKKVPNDPSDCAPAPLKAFGGWTDANWFSPTILTDAELIGFDLPTVAGMRKQSFHVVDRSISSKSSTPKAHAVTAQPAKRLAGKLANLLDSYGATMAVACSRDTLIFESAPLLFFAELPTARLKPRSLTKLRKDLTAIQMQCCIIQILNTSITAMFWPSAETKICNFIDAAAPDYPLQTDFDRTPLTRGARKSKAENTTKGQTGRYNEDREQKLLLEIAELRKQVGASKRRQSTLGAMEQLGLDDARLKSMLKLLHPDKHGGSEDANDAAKWLNGLRDVLKAHIK